MTDRVDHLTVALDQEYRIDDVQVIVEAIRMIRGVRSVKENVVDGAAWGREERVRHELGQKLIAVLYPEDRVKK